MIPSYHPINPMARQKRKRKSTTKRSFKRPRYNRTSAATAIQNIVRQRRARATLARKRKAYSIKRFNRQSSEMMYKSFTIVCPDYCLVTPGTGTLADGGISCVDPVTATYTNVFELGMSLKNPSATNGVSVFSPELQSYCDLYKQVKVVHGSVTMLKYNQGTNDGNPSTGTVPTSSIGTTGTKQWVSYLHSVIDSGAFKQATSLQNLAIPPLSNLATSSPNEYLSNSNSRLHQLSWDNKKSIKTKIICPSPKEEWSQQRYPIYDNSTPPVPGIALRTNCPWLDTSTLQGVWNNGFLPGNGNYASMYALGRLPTLSFFGNKFPTTVITSAGVPRAVQYPVHKVLLSITCAFRIPTAQL